jgi:hypothetical protein
MKDDIHGPQSCFRVCPTFSRPLYISSILRDSRYVCLFVHDMFLDMFLDMFHGMFVCCPVCLPHGNACCTMHETDSDAVFFRHFLMHLFGDG